MIIALNKPYGVLSQFNINPDYPNQRTLLGLGLPPELKPVGRLDMDSEGLLLLTDDKKLESQLIDPARGHGRTYVVQVDGEPTHSDVNDLQRGGMVIRGHKTKPCKVRVLLEPPAFSERVPPVDAAAEKRSSWLEMTLTEGKNRQVRRMTAKVGCPTLRLVRTCIGVFEADDLQVGEWRVLSLEEEKKLFQKSL